MRDPRMLVGLVISAVATMLRIYVVSPLEVLSVLQRSDHFLDTRRPRGLQRTAGEG